MESALNSFLSDHSLEEVVAGAELDFSKIPANRRKNVASILLHCCINGPVSPHQESTFPILGSTSLDKECGFKVTNGTLKKTCQSVKDWLVAKGFSEGFMREHQGEFWPNSYKAGQ